MSSCSSAETLDSATAVKLLAALAQESRLAIYRLLVERGEEGMTVGKIGEALGISPTTLSFHLKELAHAELVSLERQGRNVLYRAAFPVMNGLLAYLTENCCQGAACTPDAAALCQC